jgi:hypothetical protein
LKQVQTLHTEIFKIQNKFNLRESLKPSNLSKVLEIRNDHEFIQVADPFLWEADGELMVYYEKKHFKKPGTLHYINLETKIEEKLCLGLELEGVHLSFPFLFEINGETFMMPETHEQQEISIYKQTTKGQFEKYKVLLRGCSFVDSILWQSKGLWYLMTTEKTTLQNEKAKEYVRRLYFSSNLDLDFIEHPKSPIVKGKTFGRLGGSIIDWNGMQYLPVQDCTNRYGQDLNLFQITKINECEYHEELYLTNVFREVMGFSLGGHHLNILQTIKGETYLTIDLNGSDTMYNKILRKFLV